MAPNPDALRTALAKPMLEDAQSRHPALYASKTNIDRRASNGRTVPMGVLNLGMPRTGTMSMQRALNTLGYTYYHSSLFFSNINDCIMWDEALDAKSFGRGSQFNRDDWDKLLGDFSAVSADPPPVAFADDLVKAYPEAKVILVERDVEAWFRSFSSTVTSGMWSPLMNRIADWDPWFMGPMRDTHKRWAIGWFKARSKEEMDAVSREMYAKHYALVRSITPAERLLEYRLGDGWEPLCKLLGKEIPECNFPRVNDSDAVWEQLVLIAKRGMKNALVRVLQLGPVGLLVSVCVLWFWSASSD